MFGGNLIILNGNFITLDPAAPRASAMAVREGRIAAVGNEHDVKKIGDWAGFERIDLAGKTVTPGFIDSHIHLLAYGAQLLKQADLVGSESVDEIQERLAQLAARSNGWVVGHGFDQDKLREKRFPTRADLDRVSRDLPILIARICGHAVVVNSAALALVNEPERAAGNRETGLYTEGDANAFYRRMPP